MNESLELKKLNRKLVEVLVAKQLILLSQEAAIFAIETINMGKFKSPDTDTWARRIIAIVKEYSV
jgi:hypothetical protein